MQNILIHILILFTVVCATAKEVTLQISGFEPITLSIPEEWEAYVEQVKALDDAPEAPREMISVGPPMNRGPFKVGDDIPEEQPYLSIYPQSQLSELSQLRVGFRFMKLPYKFDDGDQRSIIEEIHDSSGSVTGYYSVQQKMDRTSITANINTSVRTWTATARYLDANNQFSEKFISVINSINSDHELNQSGQVHILTIHDSPSLDSHKPTSTNSAQSTEMK